MKLPDNVGWALIPPTILSREDLSANQKILMGRILGLLTQDGYCYASNAFLGKSLKLKPNTVSIMISDLRAKNLIEIRVIRDENKRVIKRMIYPLSHENQIPLSRTSHRGISRISKERGRDKRGREEIKEKIYKKEKPFVETWKREYEGLSQKPLTSNGIDKLRDTVENLR